MLLHPPPIAAALIAWQKKHGRHQLPWQNTHDAYRIWLSEIMLQQTQVAAVLGYYARFLAAFPTVNDLAQATQEQVLAQWSGLGYYSRARNMHRCAQIVQKDFGGQFPSSVELLAQLPGIGPSTAGAIAAFAFGLPTPILDGNVKRVFCRYFAVFGVPTTGKVERQLWEIAKAQMPQDQMVSYNQGLMDLGATLCTRTKPQCERCPLKLDCQAKARNLTAQLPERKAKVKLPLRETNWLVCLDLDRVLLVKRGKGAVWEGLWALPETQVAPLASQPLPLVEHAFSHYRLNAQPFLLSAAIHLAQPEVNALQALEICWMPRQQWADAALPTPVKKLLMGLPDTCFVSA
jgi:A/G-specific adenine glycosylase